MAKASTTKERQRPCPQCGQLAGWENNPYRPFCSQRCKLLDLGAWIDERYAIPSEDAIAAEERADRASSPEEGTKSE
ncbi:MAG: DNA gyrase inhibitor YacG [Candidatus Tectomicrobia bacterium]|nr:DNA gyrase inhibitor YacG [Candidatus Tectomicrobia bacterium]